MGLDENEHKTNRVCYGVQRNTSLRYSILTFNDLALRGYLVKLSIVQDYDQTMNIRYVQTNVYLFLLTNDRDTWLTTLISTFQRISSCFNSTNKSELTPSLVFLASRSAVQVTVMLDRRIVP